MGRRKQLQVLYGFKLLPANKDFLNILQTFYSFSDMSVQVTKCSLLSETDSKAARGAAMLQSNVFHICSLRVHTQVASISTTGHFLF